MWLTFLAPFRGLIWSVMAPSLWKNCKCGGDTFHNWDPNFMTMELWTHSDTVSFQATIWSIDQWWWLYKMMMLGTGMKIYNFGRRGGEFESCVDSWITVGQGYFLVSWSLWRGCNHDDDDDDQEDIGWENLRREPPPAELLRLSIAFWKLKFSDKYCFAYFFSWGVLILFLS